MRERLAAAVLAAAVGLGTASAAADQTDKRLAPLFAELKTTADHDAGQRLTSRIWELWFETGNEAARAVLAEGDQAMHVGDYDTALAAFTKLVGLAPKFAEAWNRRATVRYVMGDLDGSVADIERTLALEPRHFGALSGLGLIYLRLGNEEAALKAFKRAFAINPQLGDLKANIELIEKRLKDKAI